jgi:hypothetical protein
LLGGTHEALAATIVVTSTAGDRGTFTELQCLPPGSDVDPGPAATTVTGGATLATALADGHVTLREAICIANNTPEADSITLSPLTYPLSAADNHWYGPNGLPPIGDDITIEGNGAVIQRANNGAPHRFFFVSRRTLTDGIAIRSGEDRARLVLRNLTLRQGLARGGSGQAGGGGAGMGGAIFNQGEVTLERVTLAGNEAIGGRSGAAGFGFLVVGTGGGIGQNAELSGAGGFGPGQFGGALGGAALFSPDPAIDDMLRYGCGGGAGFGQAAGNDAVVGTVLLGLPEVTVLPGDGGGLGNVGGSSAFAGLCSQTDPEVCMGQGQDGGGGGAGGLVDSTFGTGAGGGFGRAGAAGSTCGGGGGVGGGGGSVNDVGEAGSGGFGGGGGAANTSGSGDQTLAGGQGGFGGGGGSGKFVPATPTEPSAFLGGRGGFGGGTGGLDGLPSSPFASGGGGAGMGGALFNHGGMVEAINTTWTANRAVGGAAAANNIAEPGSGLGGAIFNLDGEVTLLHNTLAGNRVLIGTAPSPGSSAASAAGGAVYNRVQNPQAYGFSSTLRLRGSVLADSLDGNGLVVSDCNHSAHGEAGVSSEVAVTDHSLVESTSAVGSPVVHQACSMAGGTGNLSGDPHLGPLANHGGATATLAPRLGSPAIDAGAGGCEGLGQDQRGRPRPIGGGCDIGAYEVGWDLGDAPAVGYPTLLGDDGARHLAPGSPVLFLGSAPPDDEAEGQTSAEASGDGADEDGVVWTSRVVPGLEAAVSITASAAGLVSAWVDWAGDGSWSEAGDQILDDVAVVAGPNMFVVSVPATAALGTTFGRFRIATAGGLEPTGPASDGEVEDHAVAVEAPIELSVGNAMGAEGSGGGTTLLEIPVSVTSTSTPSAVTLSLASGTATAGSDFIDPGPIVVSFPVGGALTQNVAVMAAADDVVEGAETFTFSLSNPSPGALLVVAEGTGTIIDDDTTSLSLEPLAASAVEGDGGSTPRTFSVTLSQAVQGGFSLAVVTNDGTATAASGDYVGVGSSLAFAGTAGESHQVSVDVNGDETVEADEVFTVALGALSDLAAVIDPARVSVDAVSEPATIVNDDATEISIADVTSTEDDGEVTLTVSISYESELPVSVAYTTVDGTAGDEGSSGDYQSSSGTLTLAPGETSGSITVVVNADAVEEPVEWFFVDLSAGEPAAVVAIADSRAEVTILDDDDLGPPVVDMVAAVATGEITECSQLPGPVLHLTAVFDQVMFDPSGDGTAGDITNPNNYLLLASGPDLDFSTTSCFDGPSGDDLALPIESVVWNEGALAATAVLGSELVDGLFELRLCRDLRDLSGNELDGAGDGTPGEDFTRRFRIERANLFANGHFDHCGTIVPSLAGWDVEVSAPDSVTPDGPDAEGSPLSASARVESFGADPVAIGQCVPASEGLHTLRARLRTTATPSSVTTATLLCLFFDSASCAGVELATVVASSLIADGGGQFVELSRPMDAPNAVASAWCGIDLAALAQDNAASTTELDGLFFGPPAPLFADGFESGDLSAWSVAAP